MKYCKTLLLLVVYCVNNIIAEDEAVLEEGGIVNRSESVTSDGKGEKTGVEESLNVGGSGQIGESVKNGADGISTPSLSTTEGLVPSGGNNHDNDGSKRGSRIKKTLGKIMDTGKKIVKPLVEFIVGMGQGAANILGGKKDSKTTPNKLT